MGHFEECQKCHGGLGMINVSKRFVQKVEVWYCQDCGLIEIIDSKTNKIARAKVDYRKFEHVFRRKVWCSKGKYCLVCGRKACMRIKYSDDLIIGYCKTHEPKYEGGS